MHSEGAILAIDMGTTAVKAVLFGLRGDVLGSGHSEYELERPAPGIVELEPEIYWQATQSAVADALKAAGAARAGIRAVGVTSQGETLVVLDANGQPLRKAIVWLDTRSRSEATAIEEAFGVEAVYSRTGQQEITPVGTATKILWLRAHEPEVFGRAATYLLLEDYIVYRLTGERATDSALCPSTLYYDLREDRWWPEMLAFMGIKETQLPRLLSSGAVAGRLEADVGIPNGIPVCVAPIDQIAAATGAGNIAPGMMTETTGSVLAVCAALDSPRCLPGREAGLFRHAVRGSFVLLPWVPAAGMILRWFRDTFCEGRSYAELGRLAANVPPGCEGLLLIPHLAGATCPDVNEHARGVFHGITLDHGRAHFTRAIMESVAFMLRDIVEMLRGVGIEADSITSLGGASASRVWMQIKADVLGMDLRTPACSEATCLGTALLAGVGTGIFSDPTEAVAAMVQPGASYQPDRKAGEIYDALFQTYRETNKTMLSTFGRES